MTHWAYEYLALILLALFTTVCCGVLPCSKVDDRESIISRCSGSMMILMCRRDTWRLMEVIGASDEKGTN